MAPFFCATLYVPDSDYVLLQCQENATLSAVISLVNLVSVHLHLTAAVVMVLGHVTLELGRVTGSHVLKDMSSLKSLVEIVSLSLSLNVCVCLPACLPACLPVCLSVCLSVIFILIYF